MPAGDIRLLGGAVVNGISTSGRVEIFHGGEWGAICDRGWGENDAQVVCRQLGMTGRTRVKDSYFGVGNVPMWLNRVGCYGSENRLDECSHAGWGNVASECSPTADNQAGVICTLPMPPPPPMAPPPPFRPLCDAAFNLVLVIDGSGSMSDFMVDVRAVAIAILAQIELGGSAARVGIVRFSTTGEVRVVGSREAAGKRRR